MMLFDKKRSLVVMAFFVFSTAIFGQWDLQPTNISATFYNSTVALDNKIYFAGGSLGGTAVSEKIEIWDLADNTKTTKTLSVARAGIMSAEHDGKIYFAGGFQPLAGWASIEVFNTVDILDVAGGGITTDTLSVARGVGAAFVLDGKIFFAGGVIDEFGVLGSTDVVDIYDPTTKKWSVAHLSQNRAEMNAAVIGNKAYVCGGAGKWGTTSPNSENSNRIDIYDASTGKWSIDSMSTKRGACSALAVNKFLVIAGGTSDTEGWLSEVEILNTKTGKWDSASLSSPRGFMGAATVGKKGYFIGGGHVKPNGFWDIATKNVDFFDAETGQMGSAPKLNFSRMGFGCASWGNKIVAGAGWSPTQGFLNQVEILTDNSVAVENVFAAEFNFSISPNPATDYLNLQTDEKDKNAAQNVRIFDLNGRLIESKKWPSGKGVFKIDCQKWPSGVFVVQVENEKGERLATLKAVKTD